MILLHLSKTMGSKITEHPTTDVASPLASFTIAEQIKRASSSPQYAMAACRMNEN